MCEKMDKKSEIKIIIDGVSLDELIEKANWLVELLQKAQEISRTILGKDAIKEAVDNLGYKLLKSDNIDLGCAIPLPDGSKGIVAKKVESVGREKIN